MPTLYEIWWEMCFHARVHFVDWNFTDVPIWLEMKYGIERQRARRIRNILWGWVREGYTPARHIKTLNRGRYPRLNRPKY
jgi:hypothetical protein